MTTDTELKAICRYLVKNHVVTLCTLSESDLWCASCFYLFDPERMGLVIMSETHTRHGKLALNNPQVAGTITAQSKNISLLQGVQYRGRLNLLEGKEELSARTRYVCRFPLAKLASAPLWLLSLDEIKMTDNKFGFGHKIHWRRD